MNAATATAAAAAEPTTAAAAAPVAKAPELCDEKGCNARAAFQYDASWGSTKEKIGKICHKHAPLIAQRAQNLQQLAPALQTIADNKAKPLESQERIDLIAARMGAEAELDEAKRNGVELFNSNTELAAEVRRLRARNDLCEKQATDAAAKVKQAISERDAAQTQLYDAQQEVKRLGALVKASQPAAEQLAEVSKQFETLKTEHNTLQDLYNRVEDEGAAQHERIQELEARLAAQPAAPVVNA